jgi:hypothetical protein
VLEIVLLRGGVQYLLPDLDVILQDHHSRKDSLTPFTITGEGGIHGKAKRSGICCRAVEERES